MASSILVVSFKYTEGVSAEDKLEIGQKFLALKDQCVAEATGQPYMLSFKAGKNNSDEGHNKGLEVGTCLREKPSKLPC